MAIPGLDFIQSLFDLQCAQVASFWLGNGWTTVLADGKCLPVVTPPF